MRRKPSFAIERIIGVGRDFISRVVRCSWVIGAGWADLLYMEHTSTFSGAIKRGDPRQ